MKLTTENQKKWMMASLPSSHFLLTGWTARQMFRLLFVCLATFFASIDATLTSFQTLLAGRI